MLHRYHLTVAVLLATLAYELRPSYPLPADVEVKRSWVGKYQVFATSRRPDVEMRVDQISIRVVSDGSPIARSNVLCPCKSECSVDPIVITIERLKLGVWDGKLDDCSDAPRGDYSAEIAGPTTVDGKDVTGIFGRAIFEAR